MTMMIALVVVMGLALALAHQKARSGFRPRGRFTPSVAWGQLTPALRPEPRHRTLVPRPAPARA